MPAPDTWDIEEFTWERHANTLVSRGVLYQWGYFPQKFYIRGKGRTVAYNYKTSDSHLKIVYYEVQFNEENRNKLPKVFLKAVIQKG